MRNITLQHAKEILSETYEERSSMQNEGYFPWDRGYREGYADGIRYAFELLERVREHGE